jgi:glycosyltransferase involved in cell wall biosynthesis
LLQEWALTDFGKRLVVLDRAGTAPRFEGIKYIAVPQYDYADTDSDRAMLQRVCDAENATVFISSYYTTPVKTPSVFMAHDMIPELVGVDVVNTPMWREKHFGVRHAQRFIAVSNNTAKDLRQFFPNITPDQITVAHNGVNFKQQGADAVAVFRGAYGVDRPYFLLVGARDGYKNTTLFFKAFAALGASRARYSIVCTGPALELEPQHAVAIGGAKVHMLNLSDAELQCAYSGALALIYPSLYEGFGMPILEAMACGCPVITTRKGSIPEVAGDAALYVDGADVGEMTRALKHVQKAPVRKRFASLGLQRAAGFSWKKMADQVQQVLEKALEKELVERIASKTDRPMEAAQTIQIRREQALGSALRYHQAGQLDQADFIYLELLGMNADDFVALHLHGVVLHQRGDFSEAEEILKRALVVNDVTPAAHHNLGNVYISQGRTDEAWACFTKAITLDPNFELALAQLAALDKARN